MDSITNQQSGMEHLLLEAEKESADYYFNSLCYLGAAMNEDNKDHKRIINKLFQFFFDRLDHILNVAHSSYVTGIMEVSYAERNKLAALLGYTGLALYRTCQGENNQFAFTMIKEVTYRCGIEQERSNVEQAIGNLAVLDSALISSHSYICPPTARRTILTEAKNYAVDERHVNRLRNILYALDDISRECTGQLLVTHILYYGRQLFQ